MNKDIQDDIIQDFTKKLLKKEKEYLNSFKSTSIQRKVDELYDLFNQVVENHENKPNND